MRPHVRNYYNAFGYDESSFVPCEKKAIEKKLKTGTYIKAILKKYTGYKEKELV